MSEVKCPKCGSSQVTAQKHGFSAGKAVAGAVLTGGVGLLAGLHGANDIDVTCLACGNTWNPKTLAEQRQKEIDAKNWADLKAWQRDYYGAYEKGDYESAQMIFLKKRTFNSRTPDIHAAYKFDKKNQAQGNMLLIGFLAVIVLVVFWIIS